MPTADNPALFERLAFRGQPVANTDSVVISDKARFTVLTPRLLRLEWSETGQFEDRASYAFPTRQAPTPRFTTRDEGDDLVIDTGPLVLRYHQSRGPFGPDNLAISFQFGGTVQTWRPGMPNTGNLRGTRRTLDMCAGDTALDKGLISRDGWALFDDSQSVLFDDKGWVAPRPDHPLHDWYFFAYGHNYKEALAAYIRFGGAIPMIPRFVLGAWWSRYWAYSAEELQELVQDFEAHDLPLDVLVIDMDWHTPDGWTGYTWNRKLFPDPPAFLRWAHERGLRVTLNLHPADGVQPFEEAYPEFARAMDLDTESGEPIPFRITDKQYVKNYFELLHHPMEEQGVDFWWLDWQQGESSEMKGLDPLPWLNHLHFQDSTRREQRPMLYSRWGGLGNHRYPIGFSGDTFALWSALRFQPFFTTTAANVAYGWWSHDIGGHMGGATAPELYARWIQFGALSPCLRLHSTKDPRAERRPWKYTPEVYEAAKAAFHWRYRLIPYIYTMARQAHDSGISLCRPMYIEYPEEEAAYAARLQYFFGDQMIAAPILHPAHPETGLATTDVWIPKGTWIEYTTKESFSGPRWVRLLGDLNYIPMLVKEGAILPLAAPFQRMPQPHLSSGTTAAIPQDRLTLAIFPGAGRFRLYEDDGISETYQTGQCEWTEIRTWQEDPRTWTVRIAPGEGLCEALPRQRAFDIHLEGSRPPHQVTLDGQEHSDWSYHAKTLTTVIRLSKRDKAKPLTVSAIAEGPISVLGREHNQTVAQVDVQRLLGPVYPRRVKSREALLDTVLYSNVPGQADAVARMGGPFVRFVEFSAPEEASQQLGRVIVGAPAQSDEPYDLEVILTRYRPGRSEQYMGRLHGASKAQVIETPFAWEGERETMYWAAVAHITWRGQTWSASYRSRPFFASVYTWRALVYNEQESALTLKQVISRNGQIRDNLDWQPHTQDAAQMVNLAEEHVVCRLAEVQRITAGEPLAAYLATTVISPQERDAIIRFGTGGPVEFYLNGRPVKEAVVEQSPLAPAEFPLFWERRQTTVVHLQEGENTLLVHTKPNPKKWPAWFFGAAFLSPDGGRIADLSFE